MPCNWSTTASILLRSARTTRLHYSPPLTARCVLPPLAARRGSTCGISLTVRRFGTTPVLNTNPPHPPHSLSSALASATAHLSDAQVSRVAAQAVRLCIREGDFGDALYVVNSACHSVLRDPLHHEEHNDSSSKLQPIEFGRPVSPRLAAHAFLHGLVRKGYALKAQTYAKLMVQAGIPIRRKTMESVIASVRTSASILPRLGPFSRVVPRKGASQSKDILQLQPGMVSDACARAAVELLQTARTFGQQRTERMYYVLISTLLMQGEIIFATLLFALLMKDWEVRKVHEAAPDEAKKDWLTHEHLGVEPPSPAALFDTPYPDLKVMGSILDTIDRTFARASDSASGAALFPSLQGLALFAMFLDTGQLHTPRIASLIRTMYHCPKTDARVWIVQDGQLVRVKAHSYFHDVLKRLVNSFADTSQRTPPILSRRAYNTLLSYSLRHRLSPGMATKVLNHMCVTRSPPIVPDTVTYNVLLRAGTLLRQLHISEAALSALRSEGEKLGMNTSPLAELMPQKSASAGPVDCAQASSCLSASSHSVASPQPPTHLPPPNVTAAMAQLDAEKLDLPQEVMFPAVVPKVNTTTLTTFITHLTSTGRPESIVPVLFDILPELSLIDHPATNGASSPRLSKLSRQQALRRAAQHGPYVYSSLINALAKAGEVGLAERVFILGQQAERASQIPSFGVQPWRLSVEAYTSMMQCYARVAHGRLPNHKRSRHYLGTALLERDSAWRPKARHHRRGYAQFIYRMQARQLDEPSSSKRHTGIRNAMLLYRSMMSGGRSLLHQMIVSHTSKPMVTTPRKAPTGGEPTWFVLLPDERFFNAALKLFARPVRRRNGRSHPTAERQDQDGPAPTWCPPLLHKLARAVVSNGYSIPERYHELLVSRWKGPMKVESPRRSPVRRPYAFPPVPTHHGQSMASIPTIKTRGLPVRKKMPAWMRRRRTRTE